MHSYVGHRNTEIATKSSEILVLFQQKILTELFEKPINSNETPLIQNNELTQLREKIKNFLYREDKKWLGRKTERKKPRKNSLKNFNKQQEISEKSVSAEDNPENQIMIKKFEDENNQIPEIEIQTKIINKVSVIEQKEPEKIFDILSENRAFEVSQKLRLDSEDSRKIYAMSLNNSQLIHVFSEILFFDPNNLTEVGLNKAVNDCYQAMQRNNYNKNYVDNDEKKFLTRKGICLHLRKIIKKIVKFVV